MSQNVGFLKTIENKPQGSIACSGLKEPLMSIEVEKPYLRISKSQSDIMEDYKLLITNGFISMRGDETSLQPIKLLCDTEAFKTLMFENILPLSGKTSDGDNVLLQRVNTRFYSVSPSY